MEVMATTLAVTAAVVVALWGVAHVAPTGRVVAGFEPITADNRRIITQEWLAEAFTMWGLTAAVLTVTVVGGAHTSTSRSVYAVAAALLVALAALTALTGARTVIPWFKVCTGVYLVCATLLVAACLA